MHQGLRRFGQARKAVALAGDVVQAGAQREDQVALIECRHLRRRIGQPQVARIQAVGEREQVMAAKRQRHRNVPGLRQRQQCLAPARHIKAATGDDERALGSGHQAGDALARGCRGGGRRVRHRHPVGYRHRLLLNVLGHHDHHRPRLAGGGDAHRLEGDLAQLFRRRRLGHPLGDTAEGLLVIDFLEGFLAQVFRRDLADHQDHGDRILLRGVQRDRGIGSARTAAHHHQAGAAREAPVGAGHEAGTRLMSAGQHIDLRKVVQRIENAEIAFAGHQVDPVDAVGGKNGQQCVGGGVACGGCGLGHDGAL